MQGGCDNVVDQLLLLLLGLHFLGDGGQEVLQQFFILFVNTPPCYKQCPHSWRLWQPPEWIRAEPLDVTR